MPEQSLLTQGPEGGRSKIAMTETQGVSRHSQVTDAHYPVQVDPFHFTHIPTGFNTYLGGSLKLSRPQGNCPVTPKLAPC